MLVFLCLLQLIPFIQSDCPFKFEVISSNNPEKCDNNNQYYTVENCFPLCKNFPQFGNTECTNNLECISGYQCLENKCTANPQSCAIYHTNTDDNRENYYSAIFKPDCNENGEWLPKQCKGEATTGRCFCYDKFGKRLFGQAWRSKADKMTCACSRRKADLLADERTYVSFHCDSMGNYEPLQCDNGQCWCVDGGTGDLTSPIVPEAAMTKLSCYDPLNVGEQYLRRCESKLYAQSKIAETFRIHGTTYVVFPSLLCDDDGSYGSYKVSNGIAYCSWRDNSNLGTWQSEAGLNTKTLNCNCARDSKYYELMGLTLTQSCLGNGNYRIYQHDGVNSYCVDDDGFQNSTTPPEKETDCIRSY